MDKSMRDAVTNAVAGYMEQYLPKLIDEYFASHTGEGSLSARVTALEKTLQTKVGVDGAERLAFSLASNVVNAPQRRRFPKTLTFESFGLHLNRTLFKERIVEVKRPKSEMVVSVNLKNVARNIPIKTDMTRFLNKLVTRFGVNAYGDEFRLMTGSEKLSETYISAPQDVMLELADFVLDANVQPITRPMELVRQSLAALIRDTFTLKRFTRFSNHYRNNYYVNHKQGQPVVELVIEDVDKENTKRPSKRADDEATDSDASVTPCKPHSGPSKASTSKAQPTNTDALSADEKSKERRSSHRAITLQLINYAKSNCI